VAHTREEWQAEERWHGVVQASKRAPKNLGATGSQVRSSSGMA
jgi:hypothetical protein